LRRREFKEAGGSKQWLLDWQPSLDGCPHEFRGSIFADAAFTNVVGDSGLQLGRDIIFQTGARRIDFISMNNMSVQLPAVRFNNATGLTYFDLAIDGADELDPQLQLIKGLGKALLREKLVEIHSARLLIIIDESKISSRLGRLSPLPVEIVPYAWEKTVAWLAALQPDVRAELWRAEDGEPFVTDNGNYLARCWFADGIEHPHRLARTLADRPGVDDLEAVAQEGAGIVEAVESHRTRSSAPR